MNTSEPRTLVSHPELHSHQSFPLFKTLGERPKSPLERLLSLFADVRAGEGVGALLLTVNIFLLLAGYSLMKPARDGLILTEGGAEVASYSAAAQAVLLMGVVPLYGWLGTRVVRIRLISIMMLFFAATLVAFFVAGRAGVREGVAFYIWLGIINVFIVSQFWAFANDLYTEGQGRRLFPMIGVGQSLGAWVGAVTVGPLVIGLNYTPYTLMVLGAVRAGRRARHHARREPARDGPGRAAGDCRRPHAARTAGRVRAGAGRIATSSGLPILIVLLNVVNTTGGYVLNRLIVGEAAARFGTAPADLAASRQFVTAFSGSIIATVNLVGFLLQLFVTSRVIRLMGVRGALFILPVLALVNYSIIAVAPILAVVRVGKILENSTDYSIQNTLRQALFLPTSRESKYKAKAAIDTFFTRGGDVLSAGFVCAWPAGRRDGAGVRVAQRRADGAVALGGGADREGAPEEDDLSPLIGLPADAAHDQASRRARQLPVLTISGLRNARSNRWPRSLARQDGSSGTDTLTSRPTSHVTRDRLSVRTTRLDFVREREDDGPAIELRPVREDDQLAEQLRVRVPIAGPPYQHRRERELFMREPVELGRQQDIRHVLMTIDEIEAAPDVQHPRAVVERFGDLRVRLRFERAQQRRRHGAAARGRFGMPAVETRDERPQRRFLHVLRGGDRHLQQTERDPFPHALTRHQNLPGPDELHQGFNRDRPADDGVGSLRAQPGDVVAILLARRRDAADDFVESLQRQRVAVEAADRIPVSVAVDLGQVSQRPAGSDEVFTAAEMADVGSLEVLPDVLAQPADLLGPGRIGRQELLAQAERAQRQAGGTSQPPPLEVRDLHAAATQIEQEAARHRKSSSRRRQIRSGPLPVRR